MDLASSEGWGGDVPRLARPVASTGRIPVPVAGPFCLKLLVGAPRFELELNPPKGLVLPLHYAPILILFFNNSSNLPLSARLSPREESNPHLGIRSPAFYPLNYEGKLFKQYTKSGRIAIYF